MKSSFGFPLLIAAAFLLQNDSSATDRKVPDDYPLGIQSAVTASSPGDTVSVTNNADYGPITVNKTLLIRSINGTSPSITGTSSVGAVYVTASSVTIRDGFAWSCCWWRGS